MEKVKFGIIGLGQRGSQLLDLLLRFDDVTVTATCDKYEDRAHGAAKKVAEKESVAPLATTDYKEVLASENVDAVLISTDWELHVPLAVAAMEAGKATALEVGGAYCIEDCWRLVRTYEKTKTPFMFMENCCFNKDELLATALARKGKFGTVVHCSGAYGHDLRNEVAFGKENRHYRLRNYRLRNAENYPTHEFGPIARILNLNRGNRALTLSSVSCKAAGMKEYIKSNADKVDPALLNTEWAQGDIVLTTVTCAGGETILLKLDTTLPRSYSRELVVRGTKGLYEQSTNSVFYDGDEEYWEPSEFYAKVLNNAKKEEEEFLPDVWKKITPEEIAAGHGGMDAIEFRVFIDTLKAGGDMPIDVYDAALWMSITAISEESIKMGGAPLPVPDFTSGAWTNRAPKDVLPL